MNIFVTSFCPVKSARYLDDQRVVKMMTESIQLLSTAARLNGNSSSYLFEVTHVNHPCNVWTRERSENFEWLYEHALALQTEWRTRYGHNRTCKSIEKFDKAKGYRTRRLLRKGSTPFVNSAANASLGLDFKHIEDVRKAYRLYLRARWRIQQRDFPRTRLPVCSISFDS